MKKLFLLFTLLLSFLINAQGFPVNITNQSIDNSHEELISAADIYGSTGAVSLTWVMNDVIDLTMAVTGTSDVTVRMQGSIDGIIWTDLKVYELNTPQTIIDGPFSPPASSSIATYYKIVNYTNYSFIRLIRSSMGSVVAGTKCFQVYIKRTAPPKAITAIGDSMSAGAGSDAGFTVIGQLGQELPDYVTYINAIGSQKSGQIRARQSGLPITVGTVVDNTQRSISNLTEDYLKNPGDNPLQSPGYFKGYPALVRYNTSNTPPYIIQTLGANASVSNIPNTTFLPFTAINNKYNIQLLWLGRNDAANGNGSFAPVIPNIQRCIEYMAAPKRFVVIGVAPNTSETIGSTFRTTLDNHNTALQAAYPSNYVSAYPPTATEMTNIGYTPTNQDNTDIANGIWPANMMVDATHFNSIGYRVITKRVLKKLQDLKYL